MNKSLGIVYGVGGGVIREYGSILKKVFVEGFGERENEGKESINGILRLVNGNGNVREII